MKEIYQVLRREIRIFRQRPLYILASVGVMIFNAVFYLTFMQDGLPHDLPVGIVDCDRSSTSRSFCQQLDATQLGKVLYYDDLHAARLDLQRGKLTACIVIPEEFNADIQASRQPHIGYYVNSLYFVGGALSYSNILTMVNLTNGAVQRQVLRARGVNEREILARIQPIVLDAHQIGNTTTSYGVYLNSVILPGVLGHILTGVRLAIGILWIVLVPCEMLGVSAGMGYFILDTRDRLAYSELMAMVLLIGALGFLLDAAARGLYRYWRG